jgi:hypothetical protein
MNSNKKILKKYGSVVAIEYFTLCISEKDDRAMQAMMTLMRMLTLRND